MDVIVRSNNHPFSDMTALMSGLIDEKNKNLNVLILSAIPPMSS